MHTFQRSKASVSKATISSDLLPGKPIPKFLLVHSPASWEFHPTLLRWLPRIKRQPITPGVNGCKAGRNGHLPLVVSLRERGFIVIDDDAKVIYHDEDGDLVEDHGYMVKYDGQRGAMYAEIWARPAILGYGRNASTDWSSQYDVAGFDLWRASLVDEGLIRQPSPAVLAQVMDRQQSRADRRLKEAHDGAPHIQRHVEGEKATLAAMEVASAELGVVTRRPAAQKKKVVVKAAKPEAKPPTKKRARTRKQAAPATTEVPGA